MPSNTTPSATIDYFTQEVADLQYLSEPELAHLESPSQEAEELEATLDNIESCASVKAFIDGIVRARYHTRHGFPPRAMIRAWFLKYLLNEPYNVGLVGRLQVSPVLREICGFDVEKRVPSESTFSRFFKRISEHDTLLFETLPILVGFLSQCGELPEVGIYSAIDSTDLEAHGRGKRPKSERSDQTAEFGRRTTKNKSGNKGDTETFFGYRIHAICDAKYGIPLDFMVTPGNESDTNYLPPVVEKAFSTHNWLNVEYVMADRGYDSAKNNDYLYHEKGIKPVILMRRAPTRNGRPGLYDGIYDHLGRPTCDGETPMEYVKTDPVTGKHQFRCPEGGCKLKDRSNGAMRYCIRTEYHWEDPMDNVRVHGILSRSSREWWDKYGLRLTIERMFSSLKRSRILGQHQYLTEEKIYAHIALSFISYAATMVPRVIAGDVDRIRQMRLKMPSYSAK